MGDVHACADELDALLAHVGLTRSDKLVLVGDLIVRGPKPRATLDLLRKHGGTSVRGNHEDKLLRYKLARRAGLSAPVSPATKDTAERLRKRDWAWLSALPLWIDLVGHGVRVVHAGVVPGQRIEACDPRMLMNMRCIDGQGHPVVKRDEGRVPWGVIYNGPPHVVFGHNAQPEIQVHPFATGLDTGCVYGGRLTAMVLREGETPPPMPSRRDVIVSVPARRAYYRH